MRATHWKVPSNQRRAPAWLLHPQDAINLFLGNYVPGLPGQPELWELESDVYLHTAGVCLHKAVVDV